MWITKDREKKKLYVTLEKTVRQDKHSSNVQFESRAPLSSFGVDGAKGLFLYCFTSFPLPVVPLQWQQTLQWSTEKSQEQYRATAPQRRVSKSVREVYFQGNGAFCTNTWWWKWDDNISFSRSSKAAAIINQIRLTKRYTIKQTGDEN